MISQLQPSNQVESLECRPGGLHSWVAQLHKLIAPIVTAEAVVLRSLLLESLVRQF